MNDTLEHTARRIAERGRDALLERLRPAFAEAANAHSDVLKLDDEQLEKMVQRAADRADGLQWRRTLAGVACDELGIGLGEALGHPAVARAQAIVGAPAYEDSLKELDARAPATGARKAKAERKRAPGGGEAAQADEPEAAVEPEESGAPRDAEELREAEEPPQAETEQAEDAPDAEEARGRPQPQPSPPGEFHVAAIHLGGVPNLGADESDLELRFTSKGLEIVREADEAALARMRWQEIRAVDVPVMRRRLLRRGPVLARLVIHSAWGEANFEIPGLTPDELHEELAPIVEQQR